MRYFIISDIHGSSYYLQKALDAFHAGDFDFLVILGDILYHGPRNPLPQGYNPQEVMALLNPLASKIIACRGNCDAEVDQMVLDFPCLGDYSLIVDGQTSLFATHGHHYTADHFPKAPGKSVFLSGHTHLWVLKQQGELTICNPGSISYPKEGRPHTYATYEEGMMAIYTLEGEKLAELTC